MCGLDRNVKDGLALEAFDFVCMYQSRSCSTRVKLQ